MKCCRSTPRCAGCPVIVARQRRAASESNDLITEILLGSAGRELPSAVTQQLELLAAAKRRRQDSELLRPAAA